MRKEIREKYNGNAQGVEEFKPRPYQESIFEQVKKGRKFPPLQFGRRHYSVGIDMAEAGDDKSVIVVAKMGRNGKVQIYFDEYSEWPNYKWYRNPIKWLKWRKMMKGLSRKVYQATWQGKKHNK